MRFLMYCAIMWLSVSCQPSGQPFARQEVPSVGFRYLDQLVSESFDSVGSWRSYDGGRDLTMNVERGAYHIVLNRRKYVWTQLPRRFDDIVIEAVVEQHSDFDHNAFGIACRLDPANSGRGYYFLIGGDGYYTIRWSNGGSLDDIVSARSSDAINRGKASNRVRAACIADYLALWINDRFVAEARDKRAQSGAVGLAAVMNYAGKQLEVSFDDLKIRQAVLD